MNITAPALKPIQTRYRGVSYRSRLEARWAVFFGVLGIAVEYEPEGYNLGGVWYLPDFRLQGSGDFVEIKPRCDRDSKAAITKCEALARASQKVVIMAIGQPADREGWIFFPNDYSVKASGGFAACRAPSCGAPVIAYRGAFDCGSDFWGHRPIGSCKAADKCGDRCSSIGDGLEAAIEAAASEKFDSSSRCPS